MKLLVLACCLLLALGACTKQDRPAIIKATLNGLPQIDWGTPPDSAKATMQGMQGVKFHSDTSGVRFRGGSFMGHKVDMWILDFWQGKYFNMARISFPFDSASEQSLLEDLQEQLEAQFGATAEARRWRFGVQGVEKTNVVSIFHQPRHAVEIWYSGHGYVDSLERSRKLQ